MKLYEFEPFPNPRRVRMFIAEKMLDVERIQINVPKGEHRQPAFTEKNPAATVPCLELDDGTMIGECVAISRYLEATHPEPALMGKTPKEKALVDMWQARVQNELFDACTTYFHHATPGLGELEPFQNKDWGLQAKERAEKTILWLDEELEHRAYIAGDTFSIADITALCGIDFAGFCEINIPDECTNLKRWYDDVSSRPSAAA